MFRSFLLSPDFENYLPNIIFIYVDPDILHCFEGNSTRLPDPSSDLIYTDQVYLLPF